MIVPALQDPTIPTWVKNDDEHYKCVRTQMQKTFAFTHFSKCVIKDCFVDSEGL